MTDPPRTIPSDPAEQERLMPEWVKVEVCRLWNASPKVTATYTPKSVRHKLGSFGIFAHALTIWQWMPEPVDPDLQMAREVCAEVWPNYLEEIIASKWDHERIVQACLAMAKRVREAKQ